MGQCLASWLKLRPADRPLHCIDRACFGFLFTAAWASFSGMTQQPWTELSDRVLTSPALEGMEGSMWLQVLGCCLAGCFFSLLDGWYWLRTPVVVLRARLQPVVRDLLAEHTVWARVMPTDLDFLLHMNNSRYLREADFARFSHFTRSGLFAALHALGAGMVMASCAARYRRSLRLFEAFQVRTRLLCWDQQAFYVEQRFVSPRDGRVCAVLLNRQHILGSTPDKVVQHLCKRKVESPEFPEEVMHWINYNDTSSQKLRAESGISNHVKDQ